jgi:hypothetical protein
MHRKIVEKLMVLSLGLQVILIFLFCAFLYFEFFGEGGRKGGRKRLVVG